MLRDFVLAFGWSSARRSGTGRPRRVDHVLYSPEVLSPASRWETLEARPSSEVERGTPNYACPSDHLPMGVAFDLVETKPIGERETERILARAQDMLTSHRAEAREIKKRIEAASGGKGARVERGALIRSWDQIEDLRKRRRAKHAVLLRHAHERCEVVWRGGVVRRATSEPARDEPFHDRYTWPVCRVEMNRQREKSELRLREAHELLERELGNALGAAQPAGHKEARL